MKKILNNIDNKVKENISIIMFCIVMVSIYTFNVIIIPNDELWNFSNIYKMYNGNMIYKDCNVIITPLFFYIGEILFKIFSPNYLTFRIYNLSIYTVLYFLIYKLFRKLQISKAKSLTYLIIIFLITGRIILIGANYNMLALIFVLIGIIYNIRQSKTRFYSIIQGIIVFLVFMTKQNIGVLYILGLVTINILENKNIKTTIKELIKTLITFLILLSIYCIYLILNNSLFDFVNYTMFSLLEFNVKNNMYDIYMILFIIEIIIAIIIIILLKKMVSVDDVVKKRIITLMSFSIPIMFNAYPIFNKSHIILSSIFFMITVIYFFDEVLLKELIDSKKFEKIFVKINYVSIIIITILCVIMNASYILNINETFYEPYYGGIFKNSEDIEEIIQYIQNEKEKNINVIILSYKANLYNNILKINNGKMDLPFYGNLGLEGADGLIKEIENISNTNILISKEGINYQEAKEVIEFVKSNYEMIGEIGKFYIYKVGY